ncbi:MAG: hypothetical protein KDE68_08890 [Rhodocyclaceae bacterium]|nr:hypothetical protein [Rhodocyclaceae bacterium]
MAVETKVKITGDAKGALGAIDKVKGSLVGLSSTAARLPGFTALGSAVAGIFSTAAISKVVDMGDALAKLSRRTGVAVEELSKYQYAADLSGVETEQFATALDKLNKSISDASVGIKKPAQAFEELGVSLTNADGTMRSTSGVLDDVMEAYRAFPEGPRKAAIAMDLFGESGSKLSSFLELGKEGMQGLREEAERLGIVLDDKTAKAAERLNDQLTRLEKVWDGVLVTSGNTVLPTFDPFLKELELAQKSGLSWIEQVEVIGRRTGPGNPLNMFLEDAGARTKELQERAIDARKALDDLMNRKADGETGLEDQIDSAQRKLKFFEEYLKKTQQNAAATVSDQTDNANKIRNLEKRLAEEKAKYARAAADESKKSTAALIKDAQKLHGELKKAWQASIDGAKEAAKRAQDFRAQGSQRAEELKQEAEANTAKGDAPTTVQGFSVTSKRGREVQTLAADAIASAYDGRFERVNQLADEANAKIREAAEYAKTLEDPNERGRILKDIATAAAQTAEAQAKVADQQKADFEALATGQKAKIDELSSKLASLTAEAPEIDVKVNSEQALENIRVLEAAIKKLKQDAASVQVGSTGNLSAASFQGAGSSGSFAAGGYTGPGGKHAPAGIVHRGEYVFPQEAVRRLGLATLRDLHLRGLRGYADGGLVGNVRIPQIQLGDATSRSSSSNTLNLTIDGSAMSGKIDDDFAEKITAFMRKAALKGGKR